MASIGRCSALASLVDVIYPTETCGSKLIRARCSTPIRRYRMHLTTDRERTLFTLPTNDTFKRQAIQRNENF